MPDATASRSGEAAAAVPLGSVTAVSAQAWFETDATEVTPGDTAVLRVTVINLADTTETFTLTPAGLAAGWTVIRPGTITLFGGAQQEVEVEVHPPLLPSTTAGATGLSVRVVPQSAPDDIATAETTLLVGTQHDRRLYVLQPALRGRRTARYEMILENRGNAAATCRLHLHDGTGRVEADFDPPAAGVEPGASLLIRARVRATHLLWQRRSRSIPFRFDADQPGSPTASAPATFVQVPMVPARFWWRVAAVAVVGGAAMGAWFGVVRPLVRDAARDAVADLVEPAVTTTTLEGDTSPPPTTVPSTVVAPPTEGTPFTTRLVATVPPGQTDGRAYIVPNGQRLAITDLVLQNPNSDTGLASLRRGNEVLFTWRLDNVLVDIPQAFVTPIEVAEGEQLVLQVTCTGVGDPTVGACEPALQVLGRLVSTTD